MRFVLVGFGDLPPKNVPGEGTTTASCTPGAIVAAPPSLRRMSSTQYANTVKDLFGVTSDRFPATQPGDGFSTYVSVNVVSDTAVEGIHASAEAIAKAAKITACSDDACLRDLARRAYRRPPLDEEVKLLRGVYDAVGTTPEEKTRAVLETILQSPQFLYFDESIGQTADKDGTRRLSDWALASRLSYFLWDTTPDATLLGLAEKGTLATEIEAQARRMLDDPRARAVVARFHDEWLRVGKLDGLPKDVPGWSPALAQEMRAETRKFVEHVVFDLDGRFETLLKDRTAFVTPLLEPIYGKTSGTLPDARAGLLTRAAFLSTHAYAAASSPVRRGVFVLQQVLCQDLVQPQNVVAKDFDKETSEGGTVRDRLAKHRNDPFCTGCHSKIDPIGLSFEHFDAIGRYRTEWAGGVPVDAKGDLSSPKGSFDDARGLMDLLSKQPLVQSCYATQWARYAIGRREVDSCAVKPAEDRFVKAGGNIKELLIAIAASDSFSHVKDGQ
jgi:hypothetical protein